MCFYSFKSVVVLVSVTTLIMLTGSDPRGGLTHVLPLVCKSFYKFCRTSDMLWKDALSRMVVFEPDIWESALTFLIDECKSQLLQFQNGSHEESPLIPLQAHTYVEDESTYEEQLIELGTAALATKTIPGLSAFTDIAPTQQLFRYLVRYHLRFTGPVFYMPGQGVLSMNKFGRDVF